MGPIADAAHTLSGPRRLGIALIVGVLAGAFPHGIPMNDMHGPLCYARQRLQGEDPYAPVCHWNPFGAVLPAYPLTTGLVVLPVAALVESNQLATSIVMGLCYALLAWALLGLGSVWILGCMLSFPSIQSLLFAQFTPLLLAVMLIPSLLPLALVKPIGVPIVLTHLTRWRAAGCALFLGLSLLLDPIWPLRLVGFTTTFTGYVPLLSIPGALLLLALWRWGGKGCLADPRVRFLLMCACIPQKIADSFVLLGMFRTPWEMLAWSAGSWFVHVLGVLFPTPPKPGISLAWVAPAFLYLPAGLLLLRRRMVEER